MESRKIFTRTWDSWVMLGAHKNQLKKSTIKKDRNNVLVWLIMGCIADRSLMEYVQNRKDIVMICHDMPMP